MAVRQAALWAGVVAGSWVCFALHDRSTPRRVPETPSAPINSILPSHCDAAHR